MIEAVIALLVALIGVAGVVAARVLADLAGLRAENRRLWLWARSLVDYAYRHRRSDAPDLPPIPPLDDD